MKLATIAFLSSSLALGFSGGAIAQERMAPAALPNVPHNGAASPPSAMKDTSPMAARASFTMSEAKAHIEKAGYTHVIDLVKNDSGLWQGQAMSHGRRVGVSIDEQGRVAAQ